MTLSPKQQKELALDMRDDVMQSIELFAHSYKVRGVDIDVRLVLLALGEAFVAIGMEQLGQKGSIAILKRVEEAIKRNKPN